MKYLPRDQFRHAHKTHLRSVWWMHFRKRALDHFDHRCSVCGDDYGRHGWEMWQLQIDHKRYVKDGKLIFGHETFEDVRVLCPDHHLKGTVTDAAIRRWRSSYLLAKFIRWMICVPFRLIRWAFRKIRRRSSS